MRARLVLEYHRPVFKAANAMDKYYAPDWVVKLAIQRIQAKVPLGQINHILEPAAGDGAFEKYLNQLGIPVDYFDLDPDPSNPRIKPGDFYKSNLSFSENRLVITGPPYSNDGWYKFAEKASQIARWVAFISPASVLDLEYPIPTLKLEDQTDLKTVHFRGSKDFGGKDHDVKSCFMIYRTIPPHIDPLDAQIEKDFKIGGFERYKEEKRIGGPKEWEYLVSSIGASAGKVLQTGGEYMRSIGINVRNEDKRKEFEEFLGNLYRDYTPLIQRYSTTTKKILHTRRFKEFIKEALY